MKVRVEGKTTTIFGAAEPTLEAGSNALDALDAASFAGEFYYHVRAFGPFVDQIGRYAGEGFSGWSYKINGVAPPVAADQATINAGDTVLWYWTTFIEQGGSPTLAPEAARRAQLLHGAVPERPGAVDAGCRRDAASSTGGSVSTRAGRGCVGKHRGLVRATPADAVRSNALR